MKLKNKIALITGAGRGIGRQISLTLAKEGADVIVNDLNFESADEVAHTVKELGRDSLAVQADVSKEKQVARMIKAARKKLGSIDILVNNAGVYQNVPVADMSIEDWDKAMNVNLKSVFLCSKLVSEDMKNQRWGRIICISSIAGQRGSLGHAHYSTSKAGIIGFVKSLALELAPYQITVNAVAPGIIDHTPMGKRAISHYGENTLLKEIPLGKYGKPEDVSTLVLFLVSDDAHYITGQTLSVNGGLFMA